ncbi:fatty acid synthase-like [Periplaneta americana]|uniref:fatty acid synthase-like n=1 Tax=Periplaneta americana TaxID=6978 RepID=UPI0037E98167
MEFSGRNTRGHRVMGIVPSCALGSMVLAHKDLLWNVPNNWTLEDAATVPMAYATAYYALVLIGKMKKGESLLVHSGSGAVGQAAIRLALHTGCTVYTTVSSLQKREYVKQLFPQLEDSNIGSSQDISFEELVMSRTEGAGVDLVLNSLAEDKLQASLRCVAQRGRFLELGKADFFSNKVLGMDVFLKEVNFCGVSLINVFSSSEWRHKIQEALNEGILNGMVQPLPRTVFTDSEVQKAFRYLASPKHMGKVLIRIRPEENKKQVLPLPKMIPARPRFYCNPENSYVISGGIGVFGVELADWLVQQGARKLVLTSDLELTSYHNWRIGIWRSQGASVVSCTADTTSKSAVMAVLSKANDLGPVDAIFCLPKLISLDLHTQSSPALILDVCSRHMCPHLRHFVAFCRRSAADGWSHSVMERVCEARDRDGFPALAVQWGALELEHDDLTEGVLLQSMSSCFEILGRFMRQSQVVMSSIVVAQKESRAVDIVECIRRFLGIGDLEAVDLNATLAELGIDSLMIEEMKQFLDREHNTYVTTKGLASMSISQLQELVSTRDGRDDSTGNVTEGNSSDSPPLDNVQLLLNAFGPVSQPVVRMPSATGSGPDVESVLEAGPMLFMLPGLDGLARPLEPLTLNLKFQTVCLQLDQDDDELLTVEDMADHLLPFIQTRLPPGTPFTLLGYSFGGLLALELVRRLEAEGRTGCLYLLNSSPGWLRGLLADRDCDTKILCRLFGLLAPHLATSAVLSKLTEELAAQKTWSRKLGALLKMVPDSKQDVDLFSSAIHRRLKAIDKYEWTSKEVVRSPTILLRTSNVDEDFALSKCCEEVKVHCVAGTHAALLESKEVAAIINRQVTNIEDIKFKSSFEDQHFVY